MFNSVSSEEKYDISDVIIPDIGNGVLKFTSLWYGYSLWLFLDEFFEWYVYNWFYSVAYFIPY